MPALYEGDTYIVRNSEYVEINELNLRVNIEPLQCKRYRLTEAQE